MFFQSERMREFEEEDALTVAQLEAESGANGAGPG